MSDALDIAILGLSITSSWGNGHATTYRSLIKALHARGHTVTFYERDQPWYRAHRDLHDWPHGKLQLYGSLEELNSLHRDAIARADLAVLGSYVPEGAQAGQWLAETARGIKAFYDIDTPVTLEKLAAGEHEYLAPDLIPRFDLYLSFTGGPTLDRIRRFYRAPRVEPLYCSVDPEIYYPGAQKPEFDLGYLGTYSADRQPALNTLLLDSARDWSDGRFAVAGAQYPKSIHWPANVLQIEHLPQPAHRRFYTGQRFTLNLTRAEMLRAGHSPSVRLFEAAACATPIISDPWSGLDAFFKIGEEILVARQREDVLRYLLKLPEDARQRLGERARARVLAAHTSSHRAAQLERLVRRIRGRSARIQRISKTSA